MITITSIKVLIDKGLIKLDDTNKDYIVNPDYRLEVKIPYEGYRRVHFIAPLSNGRYYVKVYCNSLIVGLSQDVSFKIFKSFDMNS